MKFLELGEKERRILLSALDINPDMIRCDVCGDVTNYKVCSIMPPTQYNVEMGRHVTILCESILCMAEYFGQLERMSGSKSKEASK